MGKISSQMIYTKWGAYLISFVGQGTSSLIRQTQLFLVHKIALLIQCVKSITDVLFPDISLMDDQNAHTLLLNSNNAKA
jgi:hypothetical protein